MNPCEKHKDFKGDLCPVCLQTRIATLEDMLQPVRKEETQGPGQGMVVICPRFGCGNGELTFVPGQGMAYGNGYKSMFRCPECGLEDVQVTVTSDQLELEEVEGRDEELATEEGT